MVIAGGSGFLGVSLATHLAAGSTPVVILSRTPPKTSGPWRHVAWDGRALGDWRRELDGAAGMVNLAGRTVDCIKTPDHRDEILAVARRGGERSGAGGAVGRVRVAGLPSTAVTSSPAGFARKGLNSASPTWRLP